MFKYLLKNFGLTCLGGCILLAAFAITESIDQNTKAIHGNVIAVRDLDVCQKTFANALPINLKPR